MSTLTSEVAAETPVADRPRTAGTSPEKHNWKKIGDNILQAYTTASRIDRGHGHNETTPGPKMSEVAGIIKTLYTAVMTETGTQSMCEFDERFPSTWKPATESTLAAYSQLLTWMANNIIAS